MAARDGDSDGGRDGKMNIRPGGTIRAVFWLALAAVLIIALALPLSALWRASTAALTARACVWPVSPRAGAAAQALIVIPDHADDVALEACGPLRASR
jgi:hypothetical protein